MSEGGIGSQSGKVDRNVRWKGSVFTLCRASIRSIESGGGSGRRWVGALGDAQRVCFLLKKRE